MYDTLPVDGIQSVKHLGSKLRNFKCWALAIALTNGELKALVAGRTDEQIGASVRQMLAVGRCRKELDMDVLVKMRMARCTIPEIAAEMGVSEKTN